MKILFLFCFIIIASPVHADIFKCPMAGGKVVYQSGPCKSSIGQNIVKGNKLSQQEIYGGETDFSTAALNDIMTGRDETTSANIAKLKSIFDGYGAYVKEFGDEAQPILEGFSGGIKVINDASNGVSTKDGHNSAYVYRLKSIHDEMKQKNIPSLKAYYDYKEKEARKQQAEDRKQQSIDEQNRLQEEANRIARQQQVQQSIDTSLNERQRKSDSDRQNDMLEESSRVAREILEIERRRLMEEQMRY